MANVCHFDVDTENQSLSAERCVVELQRGRPVTLHGPSGDRTIALVETLDEAQFCQLLDSGTCHLIISRNRAAVMNLAVEECECCLALNPDTSLAFLQWISGLSPSLDHSAMNIHSPADSQKSLDIDTTQTLHEYARAGLALAHQAHVLPAILMCAASLTPPHQLGVTTTNAARYQSPTGELLELSRARLPLASADSVELTVFREKHGNAEHVAITVGRPNPDSIVTVRLHSSCFTGDILGSLRCDCGEQLQGAIAQMNRCEEGGVILYVSQEGRGIGLASKLLAYQLQEKGLDTIEANQTLGFAADERHFLAAATMLKALGISTIKLMTNNPEKILALQAQGISVTERIASHTTVNEHNARYLETKRLRAGHLLPAEAAL